MLFFAGGELECHCAKCKWSTQSIARQTQTKIDSDRPRERERERKSLPSEGIKIIEVTPFIRLSGCR